MSIWMSECQYPNVNLNVWMSISECQSECLNVNIRMSIWMSEWQCVNNWMSLTNFTDPHPPSPPRGRASDQCFLFLTYPSNFFIKTGVSVLGILDKGWNSVRSRISLYTCTQCWPSILDNSGFSFFLSLILSFFLLVFYKSNYPEKKSWMLFKTAQLFYLQINICVDLGEWSKTCLYCEGRVTMATPGSMPLCVTTYTATYVW